MVSNIVLIHIIPAMCPFYFRNIASSYMYVFYLDDTILSDTSTKAAFVKYYHPLPVL